MFRILIVMACFGAAAAGAFSRLIPVSHPWEYSFKDVAQLSDGSFVMSVGMVMEDPMLIHFSSSGEILGEHNVIGVAGRGLEGGGWIIPADDGGCFVVAYSEPRATGVNSDVAVFKYGSDLSEEWCEVIGLRTDSVFTCYGAAAGSAGGCVLVGGSSYGERMFIREYSASGEMLWDRNYIDYPEYTPGRAVGTSRGTLFVSADRWNEVACFMINSQGKVDWALEVPYPSGEGPAEILETDSGYVVYMPAESGNRQGAVIQIDPDGLLIDYCEIDHGIQVRDVLLEENGTVVFAGTRSIDGEEGAVLESWDYRGNLLWSRRMDGPGEDCFEAVDQCSDQAYVLLGYSTGVEGFDELSCVLVKTDLEGIVPGGTGASEIPVPAVIAEAPSLVPGWVIACGVFETEDQAFQCARDVYDRTGLGIPAALWIPDWGSLSGYEGWLGYISSLPFYGVSEEQLDALAECCPDAYMVWVGMQEPAEIKTIESYSTL